MGLVSEDRISSEVADTIYQNREALRKLYNHENEVYTGPQDLPEDLEMSWNEVVNRLTTVTSREDEGLSMRSEVGEFMEGPYTTARGFEEYLRNGK